MEPSFGWKNKQQVPMQIVDRFFYEIEYRVLDEYVYLPKKKVFGLTTTRYQ